MGVHGLWKLVEPARKKHTLSEISMEYWRNSHSDFRGLKVGIDTSMVMFMAMDEAQAQANLCPTSHLDPAVCALRLLFNFVSALLNIPTLLPLFIFDGKDRPEYKRGRHICRSEFAIEPELRSMCDAFGFPWWIAPGEAEWEMADLAKQGKIDACWTGDSDIFLAFPPLIFRLPLNFQDLLNTVSSTPTRLQTYSSTTLLALPTPLSPSTFLFLATLIGGDYAPGPLPPLLDDVPPSAPTHYSRKGLSILATLVALSTTPYPPLHGTTFATSLIPSLASGPLLAQWSSLTRNSLRATLPLKLHISSHPSWPSRLALNLYLCPLTSSSLSPLTSSSSLSPLTSSSLRPITRAPPSIPKLIDSALDTLLLLPPAIEDSFLRSEGLIDGFVRLHFYRLSTSLAPGNDGERSGGKGEKGGAGCIPSQPGAGFIPSQDGVGFIGTTSGERDGRFRVAVGVRAWVEEMREGLRRAVGEGGGGSEEWGRGVWVERGLVEGEEAEKRVEGEKERRGRGWMERWFGSSKAGRGERKQKSVGKVVARTVLGQKFSPIAVLVLE